MSRAALDYDFDAVLDRSHLSSKKWEAEMDRLTDPSLLCLGTAEMDFKPAPPIIRALEETVRQGHFGYPYRRRTYDEAVIGFLQRRFGWTIDRDWIASHVGIYASMQPLIDALTEPGDEIVIQPPVHHVFREVIESAGRTAVCSPLIFRSKRYEIDFDGLRSAISARTRMLIFCSPHNPVFRVWTLEELGRLGAIAAEHRIVVVTDEVYCGLVHRGRTHVPLASVSKEASAHTVTLMSASKSFNLSGLKHSLVITQDADIMAAYRHELRRGNYHFGGSTFGEAATEAAFRDCDGWSAALMDHVWSNVLYVQAFLVEHVPEVIMIEPEAGFFVWLDWSSFGLSPAALKHFFEREARVVVTMGEPMGPGGRGHVRVNLGCARRLVEEAFTRIADAVGRLRTGAVTIAATGPSA